MNKVDFDKIMRLKKSIVIYYRKYKSFHPFTIDNFMSHFNTYKDGIKALSFMKHEINSNEFTERDYEEIYKQY
jgi:hypothetical protein|tara:strand:+ start:341 stop:559 length:219 start_codon:yes stop_codon:yes gene_type:complete